MDITTNQPAVQVYTAYWLDTPRKAVHGGPSLNYTSWSAVAIEQEGYIDAINTPEWGVDQICKFYKYSFLVGNREVDFWLECDVDYPGKDFEWSSTYKFSVVN